MNEYVELTWDGYLRMSTAVAEQYFPAGVCVARVEERRLLMMPLRSAANGGLVLKQRNRAGDRAVLLAEVLGFTSRSGWFSVRWDEGRGALVVTLDTPLVEEPSDGPHDAYRGQRGAGPVAGPPHSHRGNGNDANASVDSPHRSPSAPRCLAGAARRAPTPPPPARALSGPGR